MERMKTEFVPMQALLKNKVSSKEGTQIGPMTFQQFKTSMLIITVALTASFLIFLYEFFKAKIIITKAKGRRQAWWQ